MPISDDLWAQIVDLVDDRIIQSSKAQRVGNDIISGFMRELERYVDYRPTYMPRVGKSRSRILQKARELCGDANDVSPREVVAKSTADVAAGRVLVIGLRDISLAHRWCGEYFAGSGGAKFVDEPRKYVDEAKESGFRGIIQRAELSVEGDDFPYELQIMTYLQVAWDQFEHRFYELVRASDIQSGTRDEIRRKFVELSEKLFQSDKDFDRLRETLVTVR